eukprot:269357-Pyramimonas_sp.AAC.1
MLKDPEEGHRRQLRWRLRSSGAAQGQPRKLRDTQSPLPPTHDLLPSPPFPFCLGRGAPSRGAGKQGVGRTR